MKKTLNKQLFVACREDKSDKVQELLDAGADLESGNVKGRTALGLAALHGSLETCLVLLNRGANLETKDCAGDTPLSLAAFQGEKEVCKLFIDQGVDLNSKNLAGDSPLWSAAENGGTLTSLLLIVSGAETISILASPKALNLKGFIRECLKFPLHVSARNGSTQDCIQLLNLGYDIHQKNAQDKTPLQCVKNSDEPTQAALRSWLARQEAGRIMKEITGPKP